MPEIEPTKTFRELTRMVMQRGLILTHKWETVIDCLQTALKPTSSLRDALAEAGQRTSLASFHLLLARMEKAGVVAVSDHITAVRGTRVREKVFQATPLGIAALWVATRTQRQTLEAREAWMEEAQVRAVESYSTSPDLPRLGCGTTPPAKTP